MKVFAVGIEYEHLIAAMRERRIQLGLSQTDVDQLADVPGGYYAKCEAMLTNPTARNARSIGRESLPKLLGALGLRFAVVAETEFQAKKIKSQGFKVKLAGENAELVQRLPPNAILAERGRKGGLKRWATMTPEQRAAFLAAGAAARRARRPVKVEEVAPLPAPVTPAATPVGPAPIAPRRERKKPPPLSRRQAYLERQRRVTERAMRPG